MQKRNKKNLPLFVQYPQFDDILKFKIFNYYYLLFFEREKKIASVYYLINDGLLFAH